MVSTQTLKAASIDILESASTYFAIGNTTHGTHKSEILAQTMIASGQAEDAAHLMTTHRAMQDVCQGRNVSEALAVISQQAEPLAQATSKNPEFASALDELTYPIQNIAKTVTALNPQGAQDASQALTEALAANQKKFYRKLEQQAQSHSPNASMAERSGTKGRGGAAR